MNERARGEDCKFALLFYGNAMLQRQICSILAISGLFFQLLIMGLHIPGPLVRAGLSGVPFSTQSAYRIITICTNNGLRQITIDENNQPRDRDLPSNSGETACPVCQFSSSPLLPLESLALPVRIASLEISGHFSNTALQDRFHPLRSLARAPPAV